MSFLIGSLNGAWFFFLWWGVLGYGNFVFFCFFLEPLDHLMLKLEGKTISTLQLVATCLM